MPPATAAELQVLSAGAMHGVVESLAPAFQAASGHRLALQSATAGGVEQQVASGAPIDVAILTRPRMDKLVHEGRIAPGSTAVLAEATIGLAVPKSAPHPNIGSVEAFKKALLEAKSIAYTDPASGGTTGIHLAAVLQRLGIAAAVTPKAKLVSAAPGHGSPRVGVAVARGEAALGMQPISELMGIDGIEIVGPLPKELQSPDLVYVAGIPAAAAQPAAAKALIEFLAGPAAVPALKAKGLQPG